MEQYVFLPAIAQTPPRQHPEEIIFGENLTARATTKNLLATPSLAQADDIPLIICLSLTKVRAILVRTKQARTGYLAHLAPLYWGYSKTEKKQLLTKTLNSIWPSVY